MPGSITSSTTASNSVAPAIHSASSPRVATSATTPSACSPRRMAAAIRTSSSTIRTRTQPIIATKMREPESPAQHAVSSAVVRLRRSKLSRKRLRPPSPLATVIVAAAAGAARRTGRRRPRFGRAQADHLRGLGRWDEASRRAPGRSGREAQGAGRRLDPRRRERGARDRAPASALPSRHARGPALGGDERQPRRRPGGHPKERSRRRPESQLLLPVARRRAPVERLLPRAASVLRAGEPRGETPCEADQAPGDDLVPPALGTGARSLPRAGPQAEALRAPREPAPQALPRPAAAGDRDELAEPPSPRHRVRGRAARRRAAELGGSAPRPGGGEGGAKRGRAAEASLRPLGGAGRPLAGRPAPLARSCAGRRSTATRSRTATSESARWPATRRATTGGAGGAFAIRG